MALSHAPDRFLQAHEESKVPLSLSDHKLPLLDTILTPLISFFVAAFGDTSSQAYPTVVHFVWSFGCAIMLPLIEAERTGVQWNTQSKAIKWLSLPMIWGIFYQRLSGGWIIPLWLIAFMQAKTRADGVSMESRKAESVLVGWWIGHTLPALVMLVPGQPALHQAPLWVAFPILMSLAQRIYLHFRQHIGPQSREESREVPLALRLLYLSGFVAAFLAHVHLLLIPALAAAPYSSPTNSPFLNKGIGLIHGLYKFFVPKTGLGIPSPAETTAASGVVHFVQFDVIVVFSAIWTALLWDLALRRPAPNQTTYACSTWKWVVKSVSALLVGSLLLSPGATTAVLMMYREYELQAWRGRSYPKRKMTDHC